MELQVEGRNVSIRNAWQEKIEDLRTLVISEGIVEDSDANLWFGTHTGVYKYDGKNFTNYSVNDGLCDNLVS